MAGISLQQVANDLVAILDDVPVDRAVIAGQSFGGMMIPDGFTVSAAAMDGYLRKEPTATHGAPVLLVHGDREERSVLRAMQEWSDRDLDVHRVSVDGGHLVNQENVDAFNQVLLRFLGDHVPVTGGPKHDPV